MQNQKVTGQVKSDNAGAANARRTGKNWIAPEQPMSGGQVKSDSAGAANVKRQLKIR